MTRLDVGARKSLAHVRQRVRVGDLHRHVGVDGDLRQLGVDEAHPTERRIVLADALVEALEHVARARVGLADQHHVGLEHVADDVAERDELGAVAEAERRRRRGDRRRARALGRSSASHDPGITVLATTTTWYSSRPASPRPISLERSEDVPVRERSTLVRRGRDEQDRHVALGRCGEHRSSPAAARARPRRGSWSPGSSTGARPSFSSSHGRRVDVDAENVVALARQHRGERRAELAESDDCDPHRDLRRFRRDRGGASRTGARRRGTAAPASSGSTAPSRTGTRRSRGSGTGRRGRHATSVTWKPPRSTSSRASRRV